MRPTTITLVFKTYTPLVKSRLSNNNNIQVDILANLLYITVGFSLVELLFRGLLGVRDLSQLMQVVISFAILVAPSVLFITYIKRHNHRSWLIILDYLFLFFVSSYAFSLTAEGSAVRISVFGRLLSLTNASMVFMFGYPIILQIASMKTMPHGLRTVFYDLLTPGAKDQWRPIKTIFGWLSLIGLAIGSLELAALAGWALIASDSLSEVFGRLPKSNLRTSLASAWVILMPVCFLFLNYLGWEVLAFIVFFVLLLLPSIIYYLFPEKFRSL